MTFDNNKVGTLQISSTFTTLPWYLHLLNCLGRWFLDTGGPYIRHISIIGVQPNPSVYIADTFLKAWPWRRQLPTCLQSVNSCWSSLKSTCRHPVLGGCTQHWPYTGLQFPRRWWRLYSHLAEEISCNFPLPEPNIAFHLFNSLRVDTTHSFIEQLLCVKTLRWMRQSLPSRNLHFSQGHRKPSIVGGRI